jgi:hypothetical protein
MKENPFPQRSLIYLIYIFIFLIIVLGVMSGCLYNHNRNYRQENRDLIIKNDSIISVNIELKDALGDRQFDTSYRTNH